MSLTPTEQDRIQDLIDYAYLNLGDISKLDLTGPFAEPIFDTIDELSPPQTLFETMLNPEYLGWVCSNILNVHTGPFQDAILYQIWTHSFPMLIGSRGLSKSFLLSVYAILKCLLVPNSKVVIVGGAFRQSKFLFEYIVNIWNNAPILRDMCGDDDRQGPHIETDKCTMVIGNSTIVAIPIGDGQKIRGLRSSCTIVDEFASLPRAILENVITGFGAVTSNPIENMKRVASVKMMKSLGIPMHDIIENDNSNQLIISGTAYYAFNHFYEYWLNYKRIILSRGDERKLKDIDSFKDGIPDSFNWKDYVVMRIPYELIPEGVMDSKQVDRAKATITSSNYLCEFGAVFPTDSDGFYRRSLVETCVCKDDEPFTLPISGRVYFSPMLKGNPKKQYVFGIDPASERDNFSITIVEAGEDHRKIVYIWTTTKTNYRNILKKGATKSDEFYGFCVRKIRDLMLLFPCIAIALDTQGGGIAIEEALHSDNHILPGEQKIWPIIDPAKEEETDDKPGLHILHRINFADSKWVVEANHGMKLDLEQKRLLFPAFDTISIGFAIEEDKRTGRTYDTLEDCVLEIEELKDELSTIVHTQTPNGRDKWDTPEVKLPGGKKGRQRKDRYSSILMANMVARVIAMTEKPKEYGNFTGDFAGKTNKSVGGPLFIGPDWYTSQSRGLFG